MYGVPADLDLHFLEGATLEVIGLGQFQVAFNFDTHARIRVENGWQVIGPHAEVIDTARANAERSEYRVHVLLGRKVEGWTVHAPEWFELQFEGGFALRVFDNSEQYESFLIEPGDIIV